MHRAKTNLHALRTTFVGRGSDLERLRTQLLAHSTRLITVLGGPGIGKTRLARELARQCVEAGVFDAGAWCVDLSRARSQDDVVDKVACALDGASTSSSDAPLVERIQAQGDVLWVLDDVEGCAPQVASVVASWLDVCPLLRVVVTSRRRLEIRGELCHELAPLDPAAAVALLRDRAALFDDAWLEGNDAVLESLAGALERLPLALELVASNARLMTPSEVLEMLSAGGVPTRANPEATAPRHDTLDAAIAWSWSLLGAPQRTAWSRAAVFEGGFSRALFSSLTRQLAPDSDPSEQLSWLRDHSLITVDPRQPRRPETRYRMFKAIQHFALEQLDAGARAALEQAHASVVLEHARRVVEASTADGTAVESVLALGDTLDDLLAVHRRFRTRAPDIARQVHEVLAPLLIKNAARRQYLSMLDVSEVTDEVEQSSAHARLLEQRAQRLEHAGRLEEALDALRKGLGLLGDSPSSVRGQLLRTMARLLTRLEQLDEALHYRQAAVDEARAQGDMPALARALGSLGRLQLRRGALDRARACLDESLALARAHHAHTDEVALLLTLAALLVEQGALDEAERTLYAARQRLDGLDLPRLESLVASERGAVAQRQGRLDAAQLHYGDALEGSMSRELAREIHLRLATIDLAEGRFALARAHFDAVAGSRHADRLVMASLGQALCTAGEAGSGGRHEAARPWLVEADTLARRSATPCRHLVEMIAGLIARADARHPEAETAFARAATLCPAHGEPLRLIDASSASQALALDPRRTVDALWRAACVSLPRRRGAGMKEAAAAAAAASTGLLLVARDVSWLQAPCSELVAVGRPLLQRLLRALATHRDAHPGDALTTAAMIDAGWPGEVILDHAARNRLYAAIHALRGLGLGEVLLTRSDGYLLDPRVPFAWRPAS